MNIWPVRVWSPTYENDAGKDMFFSQEPTREDHARRRQYDYECMERAAYREQARRDALLVENPLRRKG